MTDKDLDALLKSITPAMIDRAATQGGLFTRLRMMQAALKLDKTEFIVWAKVAAPIAAKITAAEFSRTGEVTPEMQLEQIIVSSVVKGLLLGIKLGALANNPAMVN